MDSLKKLFPFSFGAADVVALVIKVVIYIVVGAVIALLLGIIGSIPIIGIITWIVGLAVEIYVIVGILLAVLDYLKVLK